MSMFHRSAVIVIGFTGRAQECYLNLHGPTDTIMGRFYSWYDAVGLMIGTGTSHSHIYIYVCVCVRVCFRSH